MDLLRRLGGNLFDVDSAGRADHQHRPLRRAIHDDADVALRSDLGSRREVEYVRKIIAEGTSAERQLRVYRETGDLAAVVRAVVDSTRAEVEESARTYRI